MVAPIIPGLNEHEIPAILEAAAAVGARNAGYTLVRLPLAVADLFQEWLERHYPDRKDKVLQRIRTMRRGRLNECALRPADGRRRPPRRDDLAAIPLGRPARGPQSEAVARLRRRVPPPGPAAALALLISTLRRGIPSWLPGRSADGGIGIGPIAGFD